MEVTISPPRKTQLARLEVTMRNRQPPLSVGGSRVARCSTSAGRAAGVVSVGLLVFLLTLNSAWATLAHSQPAIKAISTAYGLILGKETASRALSAPIPMRRCR